MGDVTSAREHPEVVDMKFWELVSVCRHEPKLFERLADSPDWAVYVDWWRNERELIVEQDRDKLDHQMPDDVCRHVLAGSDARYRVSNGHVRMAASDTEARTYSAVEIYDQFGGIVLEEVREFGSWRIPS